MEIRHFPPQGQSLIGGGHNTREPLKCACNPQRTPVYKRNGMGRFGKHQGQTIIRMEWRHNFIEPQQAEEQQRPEEPGLFLFADDRAFAAREDVALAKLAAIA